jgi:DNA-directed RNA polymerase subunit beta
VVALADGEVTYMDSATIAVKEGKETRTYHLQKFDRSNQGTCINQTPIVKVGDKVKAGQVIADGPAMKNGELALGHNVLVAYMTWHGYNYEDAVIMSERMVKDDVYTSIHIEAYDLECRETKLGNEEITRDVPNVSEDAKTYLDESGIIIPGAEVKEGDILVGKVTPKGQTEPTPEEKLLMAIFAEKTKDGKDSSLRVPHGGAGIVLKVKIYTRKNKDPLSPGVIMKVRVYIVQKRKISEGDKMSGRHGNKGVISKILPVEDMPFLPDGTPIDVMLSPMGVPSRMNIGQILEVHLGLACRKLGMRVATPVFDGVSNDEIFDLMAKAGLSSDGKTVLYDGQTGERFDERISVGVQYMIKLVHMVDDKLHARATGPYSALSRSSLWVAKPKTAASASAKWKSGPSRPMALPTSCKRC